MKNLFLRINCNENVGRQSAQAVINTVYITNVHYWLGRSQTFERKLFTRQNSSDFGKRFWIQSFHFKLRIQNPWGDTTKPGLFYFRFVHLCVNSKINPVMKTPGVLLEKLGWGVRPTSQNPYPIDNQNLRFLIPYL